MSQENVALVRGLQPGPDMDLVSTFRDEALAESLLGALSPFLHADFEAIGRMPTENFSGTGPEGLREVWLDWLRPWEHYRVEVDDVIDAGEQVLVLVRDYGRRKGSTTEVSLTAAAVWTVRDGRIARAEFYAARAEALAAVGLLE